MGIQSGTHTASPPHCYCTVAVFEVPADVLKCQGRYDIPNFPIVGVMLTFIKF